MSNSVKKSSAALGEFVRDRRRASKLTQRELGELAGVGIELPGFGLIRLKDRSIAYIVKRFDRLDDGTKLRVEDFCQLAGEPRTTSMRDRPSYASGY